MTSYDFNVIIEPDEIGGYMITCPSLQGCYCQGETIEEALENTREAILMCIEDLEAEGEEIPDSSKSLTVTILVEV